MQIRGDQTSIPILNRDLNPPDGLPSPPARRSLTSFTRARCNTLADCVGQSQNHSQSFFSTECTCPHTYLFLWTKWQSIDAPHFVFVWEVEKTVSTIDYYLLEIQSLRKLLTCFGFDWMMHCVRPDKGVCASGVKVRSPKAQPQSRPLTLPQPRPATSNLTQPRAASIDQMRIKVLIGN